MAAPTYSLSITGAPADNVPLALSLDLPDAEGGWPGNRQFAAANGTQMLCRGPDGQQAWYTIDAERSARAGVNIMLKVT